MGDGAGGVRKRCEAVGTLLPIVLCFVPALPFVQWIASGVDGDIVGLRCYIYNEYKLLISVIQSTPPTNRSRNISSV